MLPLVPSKRLAESEEDSDEIWEEVTDQSNVQETHEIVLLKPKSRSGISKEEKLQRIRLHQVHLVCLLAAAIIRNRWCNDSEIHGICYSMIKKVIAKNRLFRNSIKEFVKYWTSCISIEQADHTKSLSIDLLAKGLSDGVMDSRNSFNLGFTAACRSMQLNTRLLVSLCPISLSFAQTEVKDISLQIWSEIWDDFHQLWISIDAAKNIIDEPLKILEFNQSRKSWGVYVLALDSTFGIKDVTQKYTDEWGAKVSKSRLKGNFESDWFRLLSRYSRTWNDYKDHAEDEVLNNRVLMEKMPTNLAGFLNHPIYALEKQCKKNQIIHPRGVENSIGRFKNDLVYPRSAVHTVYSSDGWIRKGRIVRKGEEPCKVLSRKSNRSETNNLYAEWQTEPFVPQELIDGKIPKNSFGNIEIFHPSMVPKGAVHIMGYPEAAKVAKNLGLEFASAVTGFDFYKGKSIPKIEGIIINQENRDILLSAISELIKSSMEEESKKREIRVLRSWSKLTSGLLNLNRLREKYLN